MSLLFVLTCFYADIYICAKCLGRCLLEIGIVVAVYANSAALLKKWHRLSLSCFLACNVQENVRLNPLNTHVLGCTRSHTQVCALRQFLTHCCFSDHQVCTPGTEKGSVSTPPGASIDHFCSPGCRKVWNLHNCFLFSVFGNNYLVCAWNSLLIDHLLSPSILPQQHLPACLC